MKISMSADNVNRSIVYITLIIILFFIVIGVLSYCKASPIRSHSGHYYEKLSTVDIENNDGKLVQRKDDVKTKKSKSRSKASSSSSQKDLRTEIPNSQVLPVNDIDTNDVTPGLDAVNSSVRDIFIKVMSDGVSLMLYSSKHSKKILLFLKGTKLSWKTNSKLSTKNYSIDIREIKAIESGSKNSIFSFPKKYKVDSNRCFGIVSPSVTLYLEADTSAERDTIVQGFQMVLDGYRLL